MCHRILPINTKRGGGKKVRVEIAHNVNAEVAQMKCRMQSLPVSGSVKKNS